MPMSSRLPLAMLCLALAAGAAHTTEASAPDRPRERERGDERAPADRAISLDEAVARAERRHKARAVRAEENRQGDRIEYRIRLLGDDGRVFEVRVDAGSGREH
jgi:uncharacterized membrane protein YkoI